MTFPHRAPEFHELLRIVAEQEGLAVGLVEKDYWVTHVLWALHDTGFAIWFKGGTSLSKGFGLIQRFSEDLDLRVDPGTVEDLALPDPWVGRSKGATRRRREYFEGLATRFDIPDVEIRAPTIEPKHARFASYQIVYPGAHGDEVQAMGMLPFVLVEVGRARVTPFAERDMSSFVHEHLRKLGRTEMLVNVPTQVRCLNPRVTLLDKLDAISRRYERGHESSAFVRHYEDAAQIIRAYESLPAIDERPRQLADEMHRSGDIRALPRSDDSAFAPEAERLTELQRAHRALEGMFWGERTSLGGCCELIRDWIRDNIE